MTCSAFAHTIGFACHRLSDDGSVALVETPFTFADGDSIPVFLEKIGSKLRFFDDGWVIMHFLGRGISMETRRQTRFIKKVAEANGLTLNAMGELEIVASAEQAPAAFARYLSAMVGMTAWELDQEGTASNTSLLLDEVAFCLRAWKTGAEVTEGMTFHGVSGYAYKMDLSLDGRPVLALGTHPAIISSAAKKLLDINAAPSNKGIDVLVVIDDRPDPAAARREGLVLDSVCTVLMMSRLQQEARIGSTVN